MTGEVIDWLLDSDPALRWQVERDLAGAPEAVWAATRASVVSEGFGARLISHQDPDGQWAGGAFFPAGFDFSRVPHEGQPWTATTWSLNALREWGADSHALAGTAEKLARNARWEYDDRPYWNGEVDCCINSWTLSNGLWLGADVDALATWFPEHQQADGGWNCEWVEGATRSSFHSTLNALKGLLDHERARNETGRVRGARRRGEEYLLRRRLSRRLSTGEIVGPWVAHLAYPFFWRYSVLNAADYFRAASIHDGAAPDPRLGPAIELIRNARQPDGTWLQAGRPAGEVWFEVDAPAGEPSRWVTFYALRVLRWWEVEHRDEPAA
ncbi:squalene cyclase [Georgenia deserti]|uniref:Squalene cyclase n=1 Tax=Georgenia deserti TaxID=2093781 RepID=A0ABW4KYJ2_9MICO